MKTDFSPVAKEGHQSVSFQLVEGLSGRNIQEPAHIYGQKC